MNQDSCAAILADQTERALWEIRNVMDCIPDACWDKSYCGMPLWKHVYHTLHSLDLWFVNPRDKTYREPSFHSENLNNLDFVSEQRLSRAQLTAYLADITEKIKKYVHALTEEALLQKPEGCEYTRFTLMLAQHRHQHTHMGMLMAFIVVETGKWPRVVGLEGAVPAGRYGKYF